MKKYNKKQMKLNMNLLGIVIISNTPLMLYSIYRIFEINNFVIPVVIPIIMFLGGLTIVLTLIINISPFMTMGFRNARIKILLGGRNLILASYGAFIVNTILYIFLEIITSISGGFFLEDDLAFIQISLGFNYIFGIVCIVFIYTNGWIRVIATSRRIDVAVRIYIILTAYIPLINLFTSYYLVGKAKTEYQHEWDKVNLNNTRVESKICETKYPFIMLHGVGFRDLKYVNYWGRIPGELIKNGAKIYYGHQEGWGTIESNAEEIKAKIYEVIEKENTDKVNIIAHSKGGLDARYLVSQLDMGDYVASLTMISSPHHGSEVLEFVEKLPKKLVNFIGNRINKSFSMMGDKTPDFHEASKQFLVENSKVFNKKVIDHPSVYYQSYGTIMKTPLSDPLLFLPYCIVRIMGGKNDGLVTGDSAKWGTFKGLVTSKGHRGISHGDIIDLKREDYHGFDVREFYVQMVSELKESGY